MINTGSSTVWLKRTPGGQDFILVRGGDRVILLPGHANYGGNMWRQVSTVNGNVGWLLESFIGTGETTGNNGETIDSDGEATGNESEATGNEEEAGE
jgi:hypothetical protein